MSLLHRLFPPRCLLCGDAGHDGLALCAGCLHDLPRNGPACVRCAQPLPGTAPGLPELTVCGACLWRPPPYVSIHVPFRYEAPVDWLVRRLKFRGDLAAGRLLGDLLAQAVAPALGAADTVVPVPLHGRRLDARGFNQAAELARRIARDRRVPLAPRALARPAAAPPQMDLPAAQRRANVRRAFVPHRPIGGPVVLVDDVVTTASTVREAARALARGGATEVRVCAVARA